MGLNITTIEGIAADGTNHPLQKAFHDQHGLHCGFCTPGMIMRSIDMLSDKPESDGERNSLGYFRKSYVVVQDTIILLNLFSKLQKKWPKKKKLQSNL